MLGIWSSSHSNNGHLSLRLKYEVFAGLPNGFLEHLLECLVKECLQQP